MALSGAVIGAPTMLAPVDCSALTQGDCIGKKRVLSGPARARRIEPRRRCHVIVPILMEP